MSEPRGLLARATAQLAAAGVASPRVDAELLLAHVLGVPRARLLTVDVVGVQAGARYRELLARRVARCPLQHLTGRAPFRHLELAVGPGVFIPRPETELLVDAVAPHLAGLSAPLVVDLCSGSGALALAVAQEVPGARVYAVEAAEAALSYLRANAAGGSGGAATGTVQVVAGDVSDSALLARLHGTVDAVLANPPYVPATAALSPEVYADPAEAVFAGADGLSVIPAVIARAGQLLRADGVLVMEHDDTHAEPVAGLLAADGNWADITAHQDLTGRARFVRAYRR